MDKIVLNGNNIDLLKKYPDNYFDAVVTDPPYGLGKEPIAEEVMRDWVEKGYHEVKGSGFMGKEWDAFIPQPIFWKEVFRVLKPGGHVVSFFGTRTYDWGVMAMRFAGFEIRDQIAWCYGSGFPKSLSISKSIDKQNKNKWQNISKSIDNISESRILDIWKEKSNNATIVDAILKKNQIEIGTPTQKKDFVQDNVLLKINQEKGIANVIIAELSLQEVLHYVEGNQHIAQESVGVNIEQLQSHAKYVVKSLQDQNHLLTSIFIVESNVKDWQKGNTSLIIKVEEALKIWHGNQKSLKEEDIYVLCVEVINDLKHTILNQSKTFLNYDTTQKMECVSAINVIITEYMAVNLISNMVGILKSKAIDKIHGAERKVVGEKITGTMNNKGGASVVKDGKFDSGQKVVDITAPSTEDAKQWEGWGSALKPANEPIVLARKPLEKGLSIAENVLKWGTGGINIDGCRINGVKPDCKNIPRASWRIMEGRTDIPETTPQVYDSSQGRFPANLILTHSNYQVMNLVGNLDNSKLAEIIRYFYGYTKVSDLRERKTSATKQDKCGDEILQFGVQEEITEKEFDTKQNSSELLELSNTIHDIQKPLSNGQKEILQSEMQRPSSEIIEGRESNDVWEKTHRGIKEENGGNEDKEWDNIIERKTSELERGKDESSRICEHNDFNTSDGLARNGEENATKSNIHFGASDSNGDGNEKTTIEFGECTSYKRNKERQHPKQFSNRGQSESFEEASGNRCGNGEIEERKPILQVLDFDVPTEWLRYFEYTGENLGCECKGLKKVKGSNCTPADIGKGRESEISDLGDIFKFKESKVFSSHTDENGEETIEDWDCHEDCPIRIMDEQSGESKSKSFVAPMRDIRGNGDDLYTSTSGNKRKTRDILVNNGHNDSGGASRFFYCAKASKSERNKGLENERWFYNLELITDCCSFTEQNLFIWEQEVLNQSMDLNGVVQQQKDISEGIVLLAKDKECCTTLYGKKITEIFPKGIKFITRMGLNQTIELKTLNYYQHLSISDCIVDVLETNKENGLNLAENVGLKNILKAIFIKDKQGFPLGVKIVAKETQLKTNVKEVWLKNNIHSTVKPIKLMQYLARLITPPNGKVLDPFCGSGTTGIACKLEGFEFVGMEQDAEYTKIAQARIENYKEEKEEIKVLQQQEKKTDKPTQQTLF